ncbi:hypothetical protein FPV67DRAFT_1362480, partial [Lyophyllum atratum]
WFGDSATTSHVTNQRDAFITYTPLQQSVVQGVGDITARAEGRGTIELESEVDGHKYVLKLQNVLHIPTNRNNLLSLGR